MRPTLPLLILAGVFGRQAGASSRAPASPGRFPSVDGRTYVLANPRDEGRGGEVLLVRRRPGAGPLPPPPPAAALAPEEGDALLSRVSVPFPLEVLCLDGEGGYLLFDEFAFPGRGRVLERRNARGEVLWSHRLDALFTGQERTAFPDLGDFVHWRRGWWLDVEGVDLVVLGVPDHVLRIAMADGKPRRDPDAAATLLERITREAFEPETPLRQALEVARELKVPGLATALDVLLARPTAGDALRLEAAARRLELGEHAAAERILLEGLDPARPEWVRGTALDRLVYVVLPTAAKALRERLLTAAREIDSAEARTLAKALLHDERR